MREHDIQPQPWWTVALGILPGIIVLGGQFSFTLTSTSWVLQVWTTLIMSILILSGYLIVSLCKKTALIWTLPGISISIPLLLTAVFNLINSALPAQANGMPVGYRTLNTVTSLLSISLFITSVVIGTYLARRYQSASVLLVSGWIGLVAYALIDPTYGFFIWFEDRLFTAVMDAASLIPFLILLPIWVLRAPSERGRWKGILSMSALSLVLMILIPIMRDVAMWNQGVSGAQPLYQSIPHTLKWGTLYGGIIWGIVLGIIFLYSRVGNSRPPNEGAKLSSLRS